MSNSIRDEFAKAEQRFEETAKKLDAESSRIARKKHREMISSDYVDEGMHYIDEVKKSNTNSVIMTAHEWYNFLTFGMTNTMRYEYDHYHMGGMVTCSEETMNRILEFKRQTLNLNTICTLMVPTTQKGMLKVSFMNEFAP